MVDAQFAFLALQGASKEESMDWAAFKKTPHLLSAANLLSLLSPQPPPLPPNIFSLAPSPRFRRKALPEVPADENWIVAGLNYFRPKGIIQTT